MENNLNSLITSPDFSIPLYISLPTMATCMASLHGFLSIFPLLSISICMAWMFMSVNISEWLGDSLLKLQTILTCFSVSLSPSLSPSLSHLNSVSYHFLSSTVPLLLTTVARLIVFLIIY